MDFQSRIKILSPVKMLLIIKVLFHAGYIYCAETQI